MPRITPGGATRTIPGVSDLPILAIDVDGVISLFGFETTPPAGSARFELIDGIPHCISLAAGERLLRLSGVFEMVWATGWQERANDRLPQIIGIGPLPVIEIDGPGVAPKSGPAHWKLEPLDRFVGERAVAWIDDSFDQSCFEWAEAREAGGSPTLLVPTEPDLGLEEGHVAALEYWAGHLADFRGGVPGGVRNP